MADSIRTLAQARWRTAPHGHKTRRWEQYRAATAEQLAVDLLFEREPEPELPLGDGE